MKKLTDSADLLTTQSCKMQAIGSKRLGLVLGERSAKALEAWIVRKLVSSFELKGNPKLTLAQAIMAIRASEKEPCKKMAPVSHGPYLGTRGCDDTLDEHDVKDR